MIRTTIVRGRAAALIACSLIAASMAPLSTVAEYGIPAGSGAVVTMGQPLAVRAAPGWDTPVSYEIADGSSVTVWGEAQAAADGSLWYPVDGGFVPVDAVTSVSSTQTGFSYFQTAETGETWTEPASGGWVDPATGQWVEPAAETWTEPAAEGWVDPATGQWVDASAGGWVDPATGQWVEPAVQTWTEPAPEGWVDPATGQWVQPTAEGWVDPATGLWVDATTGTSAPAGEVWLAQDAVVDDQAAPVAEEWVEPVAAEAPAEAAPVADAWIEPATTETWTEPVAEAPVETAAPAPDQTWTEPAAEETWTEPVVAAPVEAAPATQEWVEPAPVDSGSSGDAWGQPIGTAYISGSSGKGAACRVAAEQGSERLAIIPEGEAVEVRGEAVGQWQPVNCAGMGGYVNTSLISWEPVATDNSGRRGRNRSVGDGGVVTASGDGQSMVGFAMQYVGYPYAYAGEGPYAFDCSGFTKFVAMNTLGIDITHDMGTQMGMGQSVGMNELQPGDLVFFANTFRPGLSHVGIYVGNGQFVHAENESTGVVVSDLNSDYYGSRWAGGTRLA